MTHFTPTLFRVGTYVPMMPIAPVDANCTEIGAGPLRFVVEHRQVNDGIAASARGGAGPPLEDREATGHDDFGASLHVFGATDGIEFLRFDCFAHDAHYHYIRHDEGGNIVCPLDQVAEGNPIEWALGRLRERLPEMLDFAHAVEAAELVRAQGHIISPALDAVEELLNAAQARATEVHAHA